MDPKLKQFVMSSAVSTTIGPEHQAVARRHPRRRAFDLQLVAAASAGIAIGVTRLVEPGPRVDASTMPRSGTLAKTVAPAPAVTLLTPDPVWARSVKAGPVFQP